MKKYILHLFLILGICNGIFAQTYTVEGVVISATTSKPIPFANIIETNTRNGVQTDSTGKFLIKLKQQSSSLRASSIGYQRKTLSVTAPNYLVFRLEETNETFNDVTIIPDENPAWRIIREVIKNSKNNDSQNYPELEADSYTKYFLSGSTVRNFFKKDTSYSRSFEGDLFITENIGKYYQKNGKQKELVLHSISSFPKNYPANIFMSPYINPRDFYMEKFNFNLNNLGGGNDTKVSNQKIYITPFSDNTFKNYDFQLLAVDSLSADTTFTIRFKPLENKKFNSLYGLMKVSSDGYALSYFEAESADSAQTIPLKIIQKFEKTSTKWYPMERSIEIGYNLNSKTYKGDFTFKIENLFYNISDKISDSNITFDGATVAVLPTADAISHKEFEKYRPTKLDTNAIKLYRKFERFDSTKFSRYLVRPGMLIIKYAMSGLVPTGPVNILLNQFYINNYEGQRIGLGIMNDMIKNPRWKLYGSAGFGLKDKMYKYEGSLSYNLTRDRYNRLEIYGEKDLQRPGLTPLLYANYMYTPIENLNIGSGIYNLDQFKKIGFAAYVKPLNWTQIKLYVENQTRNPLTYFVQEQPTQTIQTNTIGLSFRFAYKEVINRIGYIETQQNLSFPVVRFNINKYFETRTKHTFWKANLVLLHQLKINKVGKTNLTLSLGNSWGGALPYTYLFSNLATPLSFFTSNLSDGFQTLNAADYSYNNYATFNVIHDFEKNLWHSKIPWIQPEITIGNKIALAKLTQPTYIIRDVPIRDLSKGIFEANFSVRNLIKIKIRGVRIGLGASAAYDYTKVSYSKNRWTVRPRVTLPLF
ncbi:DUF5686 and carboxypeptidase-like regulatory domain-containing protein [Lacihabitans lacunae]|uniref:Carboxypeptidase-like regulatory domain-containing protein n=1 Tax=Lacihabitans lacunae TaxID=1028214 RepID=A0ABV7Z1F5_9BACT